MQPHDFLVCTFHGDTTVYVAEILNVSGDSFECRFVHSESHYIFSSTSWTVLQTTGAFPKGTPLTSHDIYVAAGGDPVLNDFVVVTFANGKSYLGKLVGEDPQVVKFLHKSTAVYVFENNTIISSGGIYPRGQSIIGIKAYQLEDADDGENNGIDISKKGISYNGKDFEKIAGEIQGNILKSHGRDHTANIFFKFNDGKQDDAKAFIRDFAKNKITTAWQQKQDSDKITAEKKLAIQEQRQPNLEPLQTLFTSFLLSTKGYDFLGIDISSFDNDFRGGMKNANTSSLELADNPVDNWEAEYQEEIHGMIMIGWGGETRNELETECAAIITSLTGNDLAEIIKVERGDGIMNADGEHIEHFGYVDGISQPKFFTEELSDMKADNINTSFWNPLMPLDLVLIKDPEGLNANAFGSYMVFRKLEQDVDGFNKQAEQLSTELFGNASADKIELTGAMLVGRFKNGMPLTLTADKEKINNVTIDVSLRGKYNDFDFSNDSSGSKCPFHAHVRKTNPRGESSSGSLDAEKKHMMARRGITYGEVGSSQNKGLLFMSFQANIFNQFQFQQEVFANAGKGGMDPLVGQGNFNSDSQQYAKVYGDSSSIIQATKFSGFVSLKGGEYFFAPSISFLQSVA